MAKTKNAMTEAERWPNGKPGNHRTGDVRGMKAGTRRGTLSADKDPVILRRRALAAQLWERGHRAEVIRDLINTWLESEGQVAVSLVTIYKDHAEVVKSYYKQYTGSVDEARSEHIAALQRAKREAWDAFDSAKDTGVNRASYISAIANIEMQIAKLDGSLKEKASLDAGDKPFAFTLKLDNANADH